jgi:hypothetical protein
MGETQQKATVSDTMEFHRDGLAPPAAAEPAILHFVRLLWGRKLLIISGSLLPALLIALLLWLWPRKYTATFVYERPLAESEYHVLLRQFFSAENLDKIYGRLQEKGLTEYAEKLAKTQTATSLEKWIQFTVSPVYPRRLQTTDPTTSERISAFQAHLLSIEIGGDSRPDVPMIAAVITENFENVLPIYQVRNDLKESIRRFKMQAAEIEDNRFSLSLELEKERATLEKLNALESSASETTQGNMVLQFTDIQNSREFLPLSYQVRAVQSKIIDLEGTLSSNEEKYNYYLRVLELNDRLLGKVEESILVHYTVQQFLEFLGEQLLACEDKAAADYLKSYIRKTENLALVNTRAGENPVVYPVAKHVIRRGTLSLVVLLMITVFIAVALEYRHERRGQWRGAPDSRTSEG